IVAVGTALVGPSGNQAFAAAAVRYNADGGLDTSFGGDGKFTHAQTATALIGVAAALESNGRLLVAQSARHVVGTTGFSSLEFFQLLPDGTNPCTGSAPANCSSERRGEEDFQLSTPLGP